MIPAVAAAVAFSHALPKMSGPSLNVQVIRVRYAPGASSKPHSHACPVVVYVLDGAIRSQVRGQAAATYAAGESFYEAPNGVHQISANASATQPATFLAYFVCDGAHTEGKQ